MTELEELLTQILGTGSDRVGATIDSPAWAALTESGLTRVGLAESLNGVGGTLADAAAVIIRAAQAGLDAPLTESLFLAAHLATSLQRPVPDGLVVAGLAESLSGTCGADHQWALTPAHGDSAELLCTSMSHPTRPPCRIICDPVLLTEVELLGALGRSCQILGALRACLGLSCNYTATRTQFGQPLSSHQVVQHALAAMAAEIAAAEAAVQSAIDQRGEVGESLSVSATLAMAAAKVQTSQSATRVAQSAHQLHGAMGLTAEYPLQHYTTRMWTWRDDYGSEDTWSRRITDLVRSQYEGNIWHALTAQTKDRAIP